MNGKKYFIIIAFLISFIISAHLNFKCPYITDDIHFFFVWKDFLPSENDKLITSAKDIYISQKNYYYKSGGRVLCHTITFLLLQLPKYIFNIINSFMFVLLGFLIYKLININHEKKIFNSPFNIFIFIYRSTTIWRLFFMVIWFN